MVMPTVRIVFLFAVLCATAGCFDVSTGGRPPLLIDNFDGADDLPADHHFDQWRCGEFSSATPGGAQCSYDCVDDGATSHSSPCSMWLQATVEEFPNNSNAAGALLYTNALVPEDLSNFSAIVFNAKFDAKLDDVSTLKPQLYVELHCSLAHLPDASTSTEDAKNLKVASSGQAPNGSWQTFVIGLYSQFTRFTYTEIDGGLRGCLEHVDSINFSINAQLSSSGQTGTFDLHVDDIYFQ
jgi:hypothetical protein